LTKNKSNIDTEQQNVATNKKAVLYQKNNCLKNNKSKTKTNFL